jgi:hypothetical protein
MQIPASLSDTDKARMLQLVGIATVALREPSVSDADKAQLSEMIGLLASVSLSETFMLQVGELARRVHLVESQLATLQRANAARLS